jgi:hypothetical protein
MLFQPLQLPRQDGSELLVILTIGVIVTALAAYFVYNDATKRNNQNATAWALATIIGGLGANVVGVTIVVVLYLFVGRQ